MANIAIVTDTDASLPVEIAGSYGIHQVPILVHFGEETFKSGADINDAQLFERVDREGKLPTTSAPSPGQFAQAYESAFNAGADAVICFCVSSKVSATYNTAVTACETMPSHDISVVDTLSLSMAQGFIVTAAAKEAASGATKAEILSHAQDVGARTHLFAALSTLKYLAMSGRVGQVAAGMATLLNVKPILTIQDGTLDMLERVRTRNKSWGRVIELVGETAKGKTVEQMAIVHVAVPNEARQFEEQIRAQLSCPADTLIAELSPGLSVHSGAGMVGVAFVTGR